MLNAKDASSEESRATSLAEEMESMRALGLEPTELDLRRFYGSSDLLRDFLAAQDLIWVRGGNAFVLRHAMWMSGADRILVDLLNDDQIVYGGFSAAVVVLAPSMRGLELVDGVPDGYEEHLWDGLGLLPYTVAPHYRSDHPESSAIENLVQHFIDQSVLFKALRDGEAIVVDGARHEVVR